MTSFQVFSCRRGNIRRSLTSVLISGGGGGNAGILSVSQSAREGQESSRRQQPGRGDGPDGLHSDTRLRVHTYLLEDRPQDGCLCREEAGLASTTTSLFCK